MRGRTGVLVIGDALLDVDVDGRVERTTPDAGLPVLDVTLEVMRPGGAGLAAWLVVALAIFLAPLKP
jgi:bifunctional ADP-heptose synthase (sugar kinase/adenylyltransferase)